MHRDLKPANIKVTADGNVKVLDFGLAKALETGDVDPRTSHSPTILSGTMQGAILGTAAYMSPEQAKGRAADARSDIWAFGCVLYEMLTGKPGFSGDSTVEILGEVLKSETDWAALPAATPARIRSLLKRCLQKDRTRRLHAIADARFRIEEALNETPDSSVAAPIQRGRERIWIAAALVLLVALSVIELEAGKVIGGQNTTRNMNSITRPPGSFVPDTVMSRYASTIWPNSVLIVWVLTSLPAPPMRKLMLLNAFKN